MEDDDFKVLNEIYKGAKMGMDAIKYLEDAIREDAFGNEVKKQYDDYEDISIKIENIVKDSDNKLEDVPTKDKVMGWTSVKMNTMMDDTTSHMAEMLIQGTVMGIIEGVKLSNNYSSLNEDTKNVVNEFIKLCEDNIQVLKKYL